MKTPMSSIMLLTLVHEIGANNAHPNQQELDEIRQESDAPTLILMSVSVNAVLFHATLEPGSIAGAAVLLALNLAVLYGYKDKYKALLAG